MYVYIPVGAVIYRRTWDNSETISFYSLGGTSSASTKVVVDKAGYVYAVRSDYVWKIAPTGSLVWQIPISLTAPYIAVSRLGTVFISSSGGVVYKITPNGDMSSALVTLGLTSGIAVGLNEELYVVCNTKTADIRGLWKITDTEAVRLIDTRCWSVAVAKDTTLYVGTETYYDSNAYALRRFSNTGELLDEISTTIIANSIVLDDMDNLYAYSNSSQQLIRITSGRNGEWTRQFGSDYNECRLAIDTEGAVYIASRGIVRDSLKYHRLMKVLPDNTFLW